MENLKLIIDGYSKLELLSLKKELEESEVEFQEITNEYSNQETGLYYEFISTAILVLGITNIGLKVYNVWRKRNAKKSNSTISVKLPNGTVVSIEKNGKKIDNALSGKIENYSDIIETVKSFLEDI